MQLKTHTLTADPEMKLTTEQQARLIFKSRHEPSKNQKKYLKDLGGAGTAEERDELLAKALANPTAVEEADRLDKERELQNKALAQGMDADVAAMLAAIRLQMQEQELTQQAVADRLEWKQALVGAYLNGLKEPGIGNLCKLASAVGCVWRLQKSE